MSRSSLGKVTEGEIVINSKPNTLYWHEFDKGRFFQVVHQDEHGFLIKLAPKTMFKAVYLKEQDDIEGIEIIKVVGALETQKIAFSKFNFAQLRAFLSFISQIDLKGISEKRLKLFDEQELDEHTIKTLKTLLSKPGGEEIIETLIDEGIISSKDLVNTSFRKRGLQIFENLISNSEYWKTYALENGLSSHSEEKAWQFFLKKNEWIFGYGLDYRYQSILQDEAHLSSQELDGSNAVIGDYLLGDKFFTTFVEVKKPSTPLFSRSDNRSNSWALSKEFINSISQILEHKASGLLRFEKQQYDTAGFPIHQKPYDSKVVLIIGHWKEIDNSGSPLEKEIKKKTFELYRRDSRNVEVITYDELFERAKYIVEGKQNDTTKDDDLPF